MCGGICMLTLDNMVFKKLPDEYITDLKAYANNNISIAKPNKFIVKIESCFDNYHISIPTVTPPHTKIGNKIYEFKANRAMALNPGQSILVTQDVHTREYTALVINKRFLQEIAYNACGKTDVQFILDSYVVSRRLTNFFEDFIYEATNMQSNYTLMLDSISIQIVIQLLREINSNILNKINRKVYSDKPHINKAIEYIKEYYNSNISIDDLCKVCNLSPYHFIRIFKLETGKTPHEFILDKKISKALRKIKDGQHSLNEVSQLCGFISQSHFSTVFKKKVGVSPLVYKRQL